MERILTDGGRARGVVTADGREITARFVAANVHPQILLKKMLGHEPLREDDQRRKKKQQELSSGYRSTILTIEPPVELMRYGGEKGWISVDGVSLTVVDVLADGFTVAIIPHTAEVTTLGRRRVGDMVNLECDVMAKYAEKLLAGQLDDPGQEQ